MTHKTLIVIGILAYPVIAFLFFCLLGFNSRSDVCQREAEPEPEPNKEQQE